MSGINRGFFSCSHSQKLRQVFEQNEIWRANHVRDMIWNERVPTIIGGVWFIHIAWSQNGVPQSVKIMCYFFASAEHNTCLIFMLPFP